MCNLYRYYMYQYYSVNILDTLYIYGKLYTYGNKQTDCRRGEGGLSC